MSTETTPKPLIRCPSQPSGISFPTHWHRFTGIANFWICSKCYKDHIEAPHQTPLLASLCEKFPDDPTPGSTSFCDFNNARAQQLGQVARRTGNLDALITYARKRSAIPMCAGLQEFHGGRTGGRWSSMSEVEGFVACEACYEDWICATPLAHTFHMRDLEAHGAVEEVWVCDLAVPYIKRALLQLLMLRGAWHEFVAACQHSLALPGCVNSAVRRNSRKWFRPAKPWRIDNMLVCEACHLNYTGGLPFATNFEEVKTLPLEKDEARICAFQNASVRACTEAMLDKDYYIWHALASEIMSHTPCAHGAIADMDWYLLPDPDDLSRDVPEFDVCAACYAGHFKATGFEYVLRCRRYPSGMQRVCDFGLAAARSELFLRKWSVALFTGDPTPFVQFVKYKSLLS